ncbi:MAG: divergent polysaccharide deacetylase family protein, partial [Erysipelotrichia bacterium]|nr:divergent polysaccharide deacetylase family protein [Erysipelotrichia bacterium]
IGYTVNMAFLPPTNSHKESAKIAQDLPFYLIHFPMQASSAFKGEEVHTLKITDSYETIEKRVKQLREWYPKAIYTNNHTGSVFTENDEAVDKLFRALKKYNFIFVDSRTSAKSVIKKYAKKYDMPYIVRNTFIDNERDYKSIQTQLKKAIDIAKKQGYAIAIGHPHNVTLQVLKESKHLFKDVEPIYLNKLPYL